MVLDQWIVTAGDMFDSVILRNEIPITDMPPCHQTALNQSKDEEVVKLCNQMRNNLIGAAFREMGSNTSIYMVFQVNLIFKVVLVRLLYPGILYPILRSQLLKVTNPTKIKRSPS